MIIKYAHFISFFLTSPSTSISIRQISAKAYTLQLFLKNLKKKLKDLFTGYLIFLFSSLCVFLQCVLLKWIFLIHKKFWKKRNYYKLKYKQSTKIGKKKKGGQRLRQKFSLRKIRRIQHNFLELRVIRTLHIIPSMYVTNFTHNTKFVCYYLYTFSKKVKFYHYLSSNKNKNKTKPKKKGKI